jgi:hypothetical protein
MSSKGVGVNGRELEVQEFPSRLERCFFTPVGTEGKKSPDQIQWRANLEGKDCHLDRSPQVIVPTVLKRTAFTKLDKENRPPIRVQEKQRLTEKILKNIQSIQRPPTFSERAVTTEGTRPTTSFNLKGFNSVMIGPSPVIQHRKQAKRSIYHISSSNPTQCSVRLQGLTIKVKIAN